VGEGFEGGEARPFGETGDEVGVGVVGEGEGFSPALVEAAGQFGVDVLGSLAGQSERIRFG
jgi:hypothetical protein